MEDLNDGGGDEVAPLLLASPAAVALLTSMAPYTARPLQEDPIAEAFCTVPAFRWKQMFYPELVMPAFQTNAAWRGGMLENEEDEDDPEAPTTLLRADNMGSVKEIEVAMVRANMCARHTESTAHARMFNV